MRSVSEAGKNKEHLIKSPELHIDKSQKQLYYIDKETALAVSQ
jgi:hypothetical protein